MNTYQITEIVTKDDVVHTGIYYEASKRGETAILWVHGLSGSFYSDLVIFEHLITRGAPLGVGFASFNNRGHNMIAGLRKVDPKSPTGFSHVNGGAGYEVFEECVHDIDAGITFLTSKGYKKIIIAGHSTGANKACYYAGLTNDFRVNGVILAGPISDRVIEEKTNPKLATNIRSMKRLIHKGKGEELVPDVCFFPLTPNRYVSLYEKGSVEDVFDYGETKPSLTYFRSITIPLMVVLSGNDEYSDRPASALKKVFDEHTHAPRYTSVIIPNASHGYEGQEEEFAKLIVEWIHKQV